MEALTSFSCKAARLRIVLTDLFQRTFKRDARPRGRNRDSCTSVTRIARLKISPTLGQKTYDYSTNETEKRLTILPNQLTPVLTTPRNTCRMTVRGTTLSSRFKMMRKLATKF